jgi:hypothetical protein
LVGGAGADQLAGEAGDDFLYGGDDHDTLVGGDGADQLDGGSGDDVLAGGLMNDKLFGRTGNDQLSGNEGNDKLYGQSGADLLHGDDGDDRLFGQNGADQLYGDAGNDYLVGGADNDILLGGLGDDRLVGEAGADTFKMDGLGHDTILDFKAGEDTIDVSSLLVRLMPLAPPTVNVEVAAAEAVADEFQVNSTTANDQSGSSTAALNDGGFVVTWTSEGQDGSGNGIYGQRYDSAGVAVGSEFQVNSTTANDQSNSSTTAFNDGGFVVTWESYGQDGSGNGIYGQRYDSEGIVVGSEFQVNSTTDGSQSNSSPTALSDGGYVAIWNSVVSSPNYMDQYYVSEIYGQRYDSAGIAVGEEFQIASGVINGGYSTMALNDGGFVVTWASFWSNPLSSYAFMYGQCFDSAGVGGSSFSVGSPARWGAYNTMALNDGGFVVTWESVEGSVYDPGFFSFQRFDCAGDSVGAEFQLNMSNATTSQHDFTELSDGGLVLTWYSSEFFSFQRFDSAGDSVGAEFQLNMSNATTSQHSFTELSDGGLVLTWYSENQSGPGTSIYGQRFDSAGVAVDAEFQVNMSNASQHSFTELSDGGFVVTWSSEGQDGSGSGIYGQRFDSEGQKVMAEPAVIGVQSLDFNDLNLIAGDSLTLNIFGDIFARELVDGAGLDQALENLASSLATYSDLFSAVAAEQGVLTFQGLTDGSAVAEVSVAITPTTDLGLETLVIDSNENNDAVIDFQATGGSVTLEGVEMANLTAAHFQLHDLSSVV